MFESYENSQNIFNEIPVIADKSIIEIVQYYPLLLKYKCENIKKVIYYLTKYNIPANAIAKLPHILMMEPEFVQYRMKELEFTVEFNALIESPRLVKLIYRYMTAKQRIDHTRKHKLKCVSLNYLTTTPSNLKGFMLFNREADRTNHHDACEFLTKFFQKPDADIRKIMERHPYWLNVPFVSIKESVEYLQLNFSKKDIFTHLYLIVYPVGRIKSKLNEIENYNASKTQKLSLCLYFIEQEYHFTGDGVWTDSTEIHEKDNTLSTHVETLPFMNNIKHVHNDISQY